MNLTGKASGNNKLRGKINHLTTIQGYSAYEIAVLKGFNGTVEEWLESLKGYRLTYHDMQDIANIVEGDVIQLESTVQSTVDSAVETEKAERKQEIARERARIDAITTIPEGSTTGDAELIDIRVGANGKTYSNAGESVRGQLRDVNQRFEFIDVYSQDKQREKIIADTFTETGWPSSPSSNISGYGAFVIPPTEPISKIKAYYQPETDGEVICAICDKDKNEISSRTVSVTANKVGSDMSGSRTKLDFSQEEWLTTFDFGGLDVSEEEYVFIYFKSVDNINALPIPPNSASTSGMNTSLLPEEMTMPCLRFNYARQEWVSSGGAMYTIFAFYVDERLEHRNCAEIDEEIIGAKTGFDGTEYNTLGEAIRTQVQSLDTAIKGIEITGGGTGVGINVKSFGAVGDGVTDDTEAIRDAYAYAKSAGKALVFDGGEYLMSGSLYLEKDAHIVGLGNPIITKIPCVMQTVTNAISIGDTTVTVANVSGFAVGQDVCIGTVADGYSATVGTITSISGNTITIEGYKSDGVKKAYIRNTAFICTSFSLFTTNRNALSCDNITIEGITFDGNKQTGEPTNYMLAPVHIDPVNANNFTIQNCTIINSGSDGISDQSNGKSLITNNRVYNCEGKGIHVGYSFDRAVVSNNHIENCSDCAIFWCYNVTHIAVTNNIIKGCRRGFDGIADDDGSHPDAKSVVTGNILISNTEYDIAIAMINARLIFSNNELINSATGVKLSGSKNVIITNNIFDKPTVSAITLMGICVSIIIKDNIIDTNLDIPVTIDSSSIAIINSQNIINGVVND